MVIARLSDATKRAALAVVMLVILGGCVPPLPQVTGDKELLSFLVVGTSREAVLLRLGEPSASFEQGRILTYRIGSNNEQGYFLLDRRVQFVNIDDTRFSLVLVFDEKGGLSKQALVRVQ